MSDEKLPGEEKTVDGDVVPNPDSAPVAGLEREDVEPSPPVTRSGMWSEGSPDTSGYGGIVREIPFPRAASQPFGSWYDQVHDRLATLVEDPFVKVVVDRGEITFHVRPEHLLAFMQRLRDEPGLRFEVCTGVSGVHYPHMTGAELHAVWHLLSITHNRMVRVEVSASEEHPHVPSIVSVYPADDWHERETFDMFGIVFDGHPGLTRILMPDDWPGHPQRKDYPLGGIPVEYKGATVPPPDQRRSYS